MQSNIFTAAEHPQVSSHSIVQIARSTASPNRFGPRFVQSVVGPESVCVAKNTAHRRGPEVTRMQYHCTYRPTRAASTLPQLTIDEVTLGICVDCKFFVVGA